MCIRDRSVGGTFAKPSIGIDAQALLRGGAIDTLRGILGGGSQSDDSADGDEAASPESDVRNVVEGLFGRGSNNDENSADVTEGSGDTEEVSPEAAIASEALNRLFGSSRNNDDSDAAADQDSDQ